MSVKPINWKEIPLDDFYKTHFHMNLVAELNGGYLWILCREHDDMVKIPLKEALQTATCRTINCDKCLAFERLEGD